MPAATESMNLRPSRILQLLRSGGLPAVLKINLSDPGLVELAGLCGVDAVWLCTEHVPNDWSALSNQVRAARVRNIDSLVRVARGSYSDYIKPFEADATGIIVPHVASEAEARDIVDMVRFHPLGRRAIDGGNLDGQFCLLPVADYIRHSNTERVVIFQIESPEGLEQVEKIAAVPGFDGLLFGRTDFSHRIGKPGQVGLPEVMAARKRVAAAARQHGKFAMSVGPLEPLAELVAEGHGVFSIGADVVGLTTYVKDRMEKLRTAGADLRAAGAAPAKVQ